MKPLTKTLFLALGLLTFLASPAAAQERGKVRAQTQPLVDEPPPPTPIAAPSLRDYREDMRKFIQSISAFGRRYNRNFVVVVENGLDLLEKVQEADETKSSPARTYLRTINGVLVEGLTFGRRAPGKATPEDPKKKMMGQLQRAKKARLKVLTADWAGARSKQDAAIRFSQEQGFVPFTAASGGQDLNRVPDYPKPPLGENPKSILSLGDVKNYLWIMDSAAFGRQDEFAFALHKTNHDLLITESFHGLDPLSKKAVATLKYKYLGARRLVLAHVDIGTAASYRYYWKSHWREGSPIWISAPLKENPDRYWVEYWRPEWQALISGDTQSFIYGIIRQGYDGVVLGGIEAYRFFEGSMRDDEDEEGLEGAPAQQEGLQAE